MTCPACHFEDTRVIDTRMIEDGVTVRRRRECPKCHFRFSTIEETEILSLMVVKRDGTEEPYHKEKLINSLHIALRKRPVGVGKIRQTLHMIEQDIQLKSRNERIASRDIGEILMKYLKRLDKIGYIRFASVYRSFGDVEDFAQEIMKFKRTKRKPRL